MATDRTARHNADQHALEGIAAMMRARGKLSDGQVVTDTIVLTVTEQRGAGGTLREYGTFQLGDVEPEREIDMLTRAVFSAPVFTSREKAVIRAAFSAVHQSTEDDKAA